MQALILAGGSGTRFWPLSRRRRPKQLLSLFGERSLLQSTVDRLAPLIEPRDVWICTTQLLADAVRQQLPEVPPHQVLCEPEGRNTAPAIGWSLGEMASAAGSDEIVAVLPADHLFTEPEVLRCRLEAAAALAARDDRVMTLGITPRWAETGYGYLELGESLDEGDARQVARFREKPNLETARAYLEGGNHLWNGGIFVFRAGTLLRHLAAFEPEIGRGLEAIRAEPSRLADIYAQLPKISIDYAVMERLEGLGTLPLTGAGWSDLGSWEALGEVRERDEGGNSSHGDVLAIDCRDTLLHADSGTIAAVGVEGLVIVRTEDSVLVMPRERSQDVKKIVERLQRERRDERL
ncbi:MAG: mannose-1-phosphate guanylyltransferase [Acidobacteriota bacterium]